MRCTEWLTDWIYKNASGNDHESCRFKQCRICWFDLQISTVDSNLKSSRQSVTLLDTLASTILLYNCCFIIHFDTLYQCSTLQLSWTCPLILHLESCPWPKLLVQTSKALVVTSLLWIHSLTILLVLDAATPLGRCMPISLLLKIIPSSSYCPLSSSSTALNRLGLI